MEAVVIERGGVRATEAFGRGACRRFGGAWRIGRAALAAAVGMAGAAVAQGPIADNTPTDGSAANRKIASRADGDRIRGAAHSSLAPPAANGATPSAGHEDPPRYRIRDDEGNCVVARLYGQHGDKTLLLQPDGQLGFPTRLIRAEGPFVPVTSESLRVRLEQKPFAGFAVLTTEHYLIFYQSRLAFAKDSARLLEDLYRGLTEFCRRHRLPVHESEFPLVAVIFANEDDFRKHKDIDPEVQAYYQIFTNRIFFYEQSERDRNEPKLVAFRKPQTVAHEGTHQILANIGVQSRLAAWPLWLVEGFTEYCATPTRTKKGLAYDKIGAINPLHMATLAELDDPLAAKRLDDDRHADVPTGPTRLVDAESLVLKTSLTPTDYAQAWALTHYLAMQRKDDFVEYLKTMSRMPPLEPRTPDWHLAEFRKHFGRDLAKLDTKAEDYLRKLSQRRDFVALPYYAVIFEQPIGNGMVRRRATFSQSPQVIQKWVQQSIVANGGVPNWEVWQFPTRARAEMYVEEWMRPRPY